ncbi:MAG: M48 family metallopeptidase [Firmicutes bacterium]|nr:M48 family metallopeptidase [Bacillota bacterium]MCL2256369.1 M48 family metallopeptidase [Bacillota bacterium]
MTSLTYKLRRSKRKTLVLKIEQGEVVVYAPLKFSADKINEFVISKSNWINGKLKKFENTKGIVEAVNNLEKLLLLDNAHDIELSETERKIRFADGKLLVPKKYFDIQKRKNAIIKWLKTHALEMLRERIDYFSQFYEIKFGELSLTNAQKKWGSCDFRKNIKLNFRLILLPQDVIDYVILHELCHTYYLDHSSNFWNCLEKYCQSPKSMRLKLKQYSHLIGTYR